MKKTISVFVFVSLSLILIGWCTSKNTVQSWDIVSITYTADFPDGTPFDKNANQTPLSFTVWSWNVIQGLEQWVIGMKIGQTQTITITPELWYGKLYDPNNIQKVSKFIFDKLSITPVNWTTQRLWSIEGIVKWTETDQSGNVLVLFDINPRQTRDSLKYTITIVSKK